VKRPVTPASHSSILIVRVCQAIVSKLARLPSVSSRLVSRAVELLHALAIPGARIIDQRSPTRARAAPELVESCLQLCATRPPHPALASSCTCQMPGPDLRFTVDAGGVAITVFTEIRHTDWVCFTGRVTPKIPREYPSNADPITKVSRICHLQPSGGRQGASSPHSS
jgi:hypothetical protein